MKAAVLLLILAGMSFAETTAEDREPILALQVKLGQTQLALQQKVDAWAAQVQQLTREAPESATIQTIQKEIETAKAALASKCASGLGDDLKCKSIQAEHTAVPLKGGK